MKIKIITILVLIGFFYSFHTFDNDAFYYKNLEHKGIKKITEKTHNKWEAISFFDEKGYLFHEINFYKKEIRSDYKYDYIVTDTVLEIRRIDTINKEVNKQEKIDRYYYTSLGQCYKHISYFSNSNNSFHYEDNFIFEDGLLVSYTQGNIGAVKIIYKYNEKKQRIQEMEIRNQTDTTFYSYVYNKLGELTDFIQKSNNNEVVYSDGAVWSCNKRNKIHIRFSNFDKQGNWTRSYYLTEKGKVFRSKREIEYW
jgi:hypothetical protein